MKLKHYTTPKVYIETVAPVLTICLGSQPEGQITGNPTVGGGIGGGTSQTMPGRAIYI